MIVIHGLITDEENVIGQNKYKNLENARNPTPNDIQIMENYLNNSRHIKTLYITQFGGLCLAKFQYDGSPFTEYKQYEGKFFGRMDTKSKSTYSVKDKKEKVRKFFVPFVEYEIVGEYENKNYKKVDPKMSTGEYVEKMKTLLFEQYVNNTNQSVSFGVLKEQ